MTFRSPVLIALSLAAVSFGAERPLAGGVTFRTDDNGVAEYWRLRAETFAKHKLPFGAALNLLAADGDPGMMAMIKAMQVAGHDIMDHTPSHSNLTMNVERDDDIAWCKEQPGLDHFAGKMACLRYEFPIPPETRESRQVDISGHTMRPVVREGAERWFQDSEYIYIPAAKMLCRINHRECVDGSYHLKSVWGENNIALAELKNVPVRILASHEVLPTTAGIAVLAQTVRRVCDRHGLAYPVTYCAPGNSPHLTRGVMKATYGAQFGYLSAGVYPSFAARVFNEPDPQQDAIFGMQWGDLSDEGPSLAELKYDIAQYLARNKVVIIGSHILQDPASWPAYFTKMDALLGWLQTKRIPVKSHADWGRILYQSGITLQGDVFPPLDRDLDEDGLPDGFELLQGRVGKTPAGSGAPDQRMITTSTPDDCIFRVHGLGGLPHGASEIACWLSGPAGSKVAITVHGAGEVVFTVQGEGWKRYATTLVIPDGLATARIDCTWRGQATGALSICGVSLASQPGAKL